MVEELRDDGITVLLVTHYADEAERLCDRVALIQSGRLAAAGTPAELIASAAATQASRPRHASARFNLDDAIVALTGGEES
jgi:ABC-2 type transport system ATP-binding protein